MQIKHILPAYCTEVSRECPLNKLSPHFTVRSELLTRWKIRQKHNSDRLTRAGSNFSLYSVVRQENIFFPMLLTTDY